MKPPVNAKAFQCQTKKGRHKQNNTSALKHRVSKFVLFCTSAVLIYLTSISSVQADRILILGDSLSAAYKIPWESGWVQLLAEDMSPEHEIINASVSGETTGGGLARLPSLLEQHQADWVIIELGGNDGLRGYPLNLIRENLNKMGVLVENSGAQSIFLGIRIPPNYGQRYNDAFTAIFPEVAAEFNAPYLDFYLEEIATNLEMMQEDKIHPSEAAQPIIRDQIIEFLESTIESD